MRKLLFVGAVGVVAMIARRLLGIFRDSTDFTSVDAQQPQRAVEAMEQAADVPGGVRP
ncbi:MAG: hypothetical protein JWP02_3293 [Acidimicrobiales bacterium]|nr:hypothetical protein [Acidimicrobiales bacterium]